MKYNIDICGLQETKIPNGLDEDIQGNRLICFKSECEHYGNGFIVNKRIVENIEKYWCVSDRISVIQLSSMEQDNYIAKLKDEDELKMTITKQNNYKSEMRGTITKNYKRKTETYNTHNQRICCTTYAE